MRVYVSFLYLHNLSAKIQDALHFWTEEVYASDPPVVILLDQTKFLMETLRDLEIAKHTSLATMGGNGS